MLPQISSITVLTSIYDGGIGENYHHFLLVELLPPQTFNIHVLDIHGNVIKTEGLTTH